MDQNFDKYQYIIINFCEVLTLSNLLKKASM